MPIIIIHIGDIHLRSADDEILTRIDQIVAAVRAQRLAPSACLVVVAGDVAFSGKSDEYSLAYGYFQELLARLEQEFPGVKAEIVFVPGNHDCDMTLASDIRQAGQIRHLLPKIDVEGAFVKEYLSVQNPFFEFAARFGQLQETSRDRLVARRTFVTAHSNTVGVTCYNTAWLSENPEVPGRLYYPPDLHIAPVDLTADVEIAVVHHPYHWLEPDNRHAFQKAVEMRADIVITGHEHLPDSYTTERSGGLVRFIAGQALFDTKAKTNGFNVIAIDIAEQQWALTTLIWDRSAYRQSEQGRSKGSFIRNEALADQGFANSPAFLSELTDVGTGFTHSRKELRLNDIFVYPSLVHRPLQQRIEGVRSSPSRVPSQDVPKFMCGQPRLLVLGADRSGKTSLARTVYRLLQHERGLVPLLLNGCDLKAGAQLPVALDAAYRRQYAPTTLERFNQLPTSRKALIVDDLDAAQISQRALGSAVQRFGDWFETIIIFADERFQIDRIVTGGDRSLLLDYRHYHIEEFNLVLRGQLIKRWVALGRPECEDQAFDREVETREKTIDTVLDRQLLPAYPIILLALLQALEVSRNVNAASGSYGELYEALITERLASISKKPSDLGTKYTVIARLAYFMYKSDADSATSGDFETICDEYLAEYQIRLDPGRLIEDLLSAQIIDRRNGSYKFKYAYYYHFFVARYFRDNLQDPLQATALRCQLEHMADRVYYDTYVNIIVFYLYLTKDNSTIERILANAEAIYSGVSPAQIEADVSFLNRLYVTTPRPVLLPDADLDKNRDAVRQQMDDAEESIRQHGASDKVKYSDDLDDFIKINIALKTVHILGQVLRNFPGSLRREIKLRIAEQCYMLGLRILGFVLASMETNTEDLRVYFSLLIRHRQPSLTIEALTQTADEAMIALVEFWAFGVIKTISAAVGMEDLAETYKEVLQRHEEMLSVQMIDASIKLDHWVFPEAQIDGLHKRVYKNYVAFSVLRFMVAAYFTVNRSGHAVRQKYTKLFDIGISAAALLEAGPSRPNDG